mmetsp:Transcript_35373/g.57682  ORF Transcript_35373/g.57682 Transcript_35373/m.57682 type:complete len:126 (-) Transcript_35373:622-999(-)
MGGDDVDDEGKECDSDGVQRQLQHQNQAPQQQQKQQNQRVPRLEGCHEITSAKQRLTTAETWNESTSEAVKSAQGQLESAQVQFQASRNEVDEAESALNEVCKKWEVIDVDEEGGMCESDRQWWQ